MKNHNMLCDQSKEFDRAGSEAIVAAAKAVAAERLAASDAAVDSLQQAVARYELAGWPDAKERAAEAEVAIAGIRLAQARLRAELRSAGVKRLALSDAAVAAVKAAAVPPVECGPDMPLAPARGPLKVFRPIELVPGSVGSARDAGHWERGEDQRRRGARVKDVFDRMDEAARKAHKAKGEAAGRYEAPFTPAQIQMARDYAVLSERREKGGIKCASLEAAGRAAGGRGGDFMDAYLADGQRLAVLHLRIGDGAAMAVRRIRPGKRGVAARGLIKTRALVDMVCLRDMDLGQVLAAHGWAVYGDTRSALRRALAGALDRMQGYDLPRAHR